METIDHAETSPLEPETPLPAAVTAPVEPLRRRLPSMRVGAVLAVGAVALFAGWLAFRGGDDAPAAAAPGTIQAASPSDLSSLADSLDTPVYWAGKRKGFTNELTRTADGRVYIRYLPAGVKVGDPRATFLTIGTYPRAKAFDELKRAAKAKGTVSVGLQDGGLMIFSQQKPTSVYFGFPKSPFQVEVFDPSADTARRLVLSGDIVPVH